MRVLSDFKPESLRPIGNGNHYVIFDSVEKSVVDNPMDENPAGRTEYDSEWIEIEGEPEYGKVVSAIVRSRYSSDDVQAIIANKALADDETSDITADKRAEYKREFSEFQEWRRKAKEVAEEVVSPQETESV